MSIQPSSLAVLPATETDEAVPPSLAMERAAMAAATMAEAFERRPGREQTPGAISILLTTWFPCSWRPARIAGAFLRTHDADGVPAHRIDLLAKSRLGRDSAVETRRRLIAASADAGGPLIAYAQPGLALVVPRQAVARATVVGDPARLRRYTSARSPADAPIAAARMALEDALAANWPSAGNLWQAPPVRFLSRHQRLNAFAALPGDVGPALARYDAVRGSADPITVVRTGGLLLSFLPRKAHLLGLRLVNVRSL
jgi:hypothetical protein